MTDTQRRDGLREKFQALRSFVETIPAEKLDMHWYDPPTMGCGCVLHHGWVSGGCNSDFANARSAAVALGMDVHGADAEHLFACGGVKYPEHRGQPAKDEFLRRLSVLEEKYCGGEK